MMKAFAVTLALLGVASAACFAERGPLKGFGDAGKEAGDATPEATGPCPAPSGGNDLSFDLECLGGSCDLNTHLDFHVDPSSKSYPSCFDATGTTGNLELRGLTGASGSALSLGVTAYKGAGKYTLVSVPENDDLLFELSGMLPCADAADNTNDLTLLIVNGVGERDAEINDAGQPATCDIDVATDCTNGEGLHTVAGTLSCTFPSPSPGMECTLTNGKFQFGGCAP
jgi:hypothetical protein